MPRKKAINKKYTNDPKNKKKGMNKTSSNKPIRRITKRNCKQDLLIQSLINFFSTKKNMNVILPIINGKSKISLRLIDWFVTNYCKKNTVRYYIKDSSGSRKQFDVHLNYKTSLTHLYQSSQNTLFHHHFHQIQHFLIYHIIGP